MNVDVVNDVGVDLVLPNDLLLFKENEPVIMPNVNVRYSKVFVNEKVNLVQRHVESLLNTVISVKGVVNFLNVV